MGTRSLTVFRDEEKKEICVLYRQYDGYPKGHGKDLLDFLKDGQGVNGFGNSDSKQFNGMGCLAAQVVAHFKKGVGDFYIYPAGARDAWEEYIYFIDYKKSGDDGKWQPVVTCFDVYEDKEIDLETAVQP